jgi:hypothetical protein
MSDTTNNAPTLSTAAAGPGDAPVLAPPPVPRPIRRAWDWLVRYDGMHQDLAQRVAELRAQDPVMDEAFDMLADAIYPNLPTPYKVGEKLPRSDYTWMPPETPAIWPVMKGWSDEDWRDHAMVLIAGARICKPKLGMGVTSGYNGDSYPSTIVRISPSGATFWAERDETTVAPLANMVAVQYGHPTKEPEFIRADHMQTAFTRRKDGSYREQGQHGNYAGLGFRQSRYNPSV